MNENQSFFNPMESVGIEHNRLLKEVLYSLSESSSKEEKIWSVNRQLDSESLLRENKLRFAKSSNPLNLNNIITDYNVYKNSKDSYMAFGSAENYMSHSSERTNLIFHEEKTQNEVVEVLDLLELKQWKLLDITKEIERREKLVDSNFDEDTSEVVYSFYSTLRHSLTYWAPTSQGGEGGFDIASNNNDPTLTAAQADINWWKVGGCDAVGALVGCRGGLWGAVITGAGASAISVIMQL